MDSHRFLVTGSSGCLGAWALRLLVAEGTPVVALDVNDDRRRPGLVMTSDELAEVDFRQGDVTDTEGVVSLVGEVGITHIVHLAALQVPFCAADPVLGARVNVVGTINILEAARQSESVRGLAYASSIAVFGTPGMYSGGVARDDSAQAPFTLYGAYKQANEATARVYAADWGVGSVGLRPSVVYGPGRDQGMTSDLTTAMVAALAGVPYRIGFGGDVAFEHAEDVARAFIASARAEVAGAETINLGGPTAPVADIVAGIEAAVPGSAGVITHADDPLPIPGRIDGTRRGEVLPGVTFRQVDEGVAGAVAEMSDLLDRGLVSPPS